jgi:hypothetical protein
MGWLCAIFLGAIAIAASIMWAANKYNIHI